MFLANIETFLRTPILKNYCERLLLGVSLERFPTWTNNIGSEEDVFSKQKPNQPFENSAVRKKTFLFMMFFIILFFSVSPLHFRRHLPCIIQKQPPSGVPRKRCSENMQQIYKRHPCRSAISITLQSNFIEIALRHGCSPVNLLYIFRTPFPKNSSGWLLLIIENDSSESFKTA